MSALNLFRLPLEFGVSTVTGGPELFDVTVDPNGTIVAPIGSLAIQADPPLLWQNFDGADVWTLISGGASTVYPDNVFVTFGSDVLPGTDDNIQVGVSTGPRVFSIGNPASFGTPIVGDSMPVQIASSSCTLEAGDLTLTSGTGGVRSGDLILDAGGENVAGDGPKQGVILLFGTVGGGTGDGLTGTGPDAFTGSVPIIKRVTVDDPGTAFAWPVRQRKGPAGDPAQLYDVMFQKTVDVPGGAATIKIQTNATGGPLPGDYVDWVTITITAMAVGDIVRLGDPEVVINVASTGEAFKDTEIKVIPAGAAASYEGILTVSLVN